MRKFRIKNMNYLALAIILLLSTGFAFLASDLLLRGNVLLKAYTFRMTLNNPSVKTGSVAGDTPTVSSDGTKLYCGADFTYPGEYYEVEFYIVNSGTQDGEITTLTFPSLTTTESRYISYSLKYENGDPVSLHDIIESNTSTKVLYRVTYNSTASINDLSSNYTIKNLDLTMKFTRVD